MIASRPVVAVMAAWSGLVPVAKALGEGSSMTYTSGLGMPSPIASASTMSWSGGVAAADRPGGPPTPRAPGGPRSGARRRSRPEPGSPAITMPTTTSAVRGGGPGGRLGRGRDDQPDHGADADPDHEEQDDVDDGPALVAGDLAVHGGVSSAGRRRARRGVAAGPGLVKLTSGTARSASPASKKSTGWKPKAPARRLRGKVWRAML